jgi:hypothetical protein
MASSSYGNTPKKTASSRRRSSLRWPGLAIALAALGLSAAAIQHSVAQRAAGAARAAVPAPHSDLSAMPLSFEANAGQAPAQVEYLAHGRGYAIGLSSQGALLSLASEPAQAAATPALIRLQLTGAHADVRPVAEQALPGRVNYLIGNDRSRWRTDIATYGKVRYAGVYPGVDVVYYGNQGHLEYDFAVAPGASAQPIGLSFEGADALRTDTAGNLQVTKGGHQLVFERPVAYQLEDGQRQRVAASYRVEGRAIAFELGAYDHSRALVIDPVLSYFSYLGGSGYDVAGIAPPSGSSSYFSGQAAAIDAAGDLYVAGYTNSTDFPTQSAFAPPPPKANPNGGQSWAFVTKFAPDAKTLIFSTYIGGTGGSDRAASIAVDSNGNAIVVGVAVSHDFPVTSGAYQTVCNPNYNGSVQVSNCDAGGFAAFVSKLSKSGALLYSTFLSGTNTNTGAYAVAVDATGRAYVAGQTLPGAIVPAGTGGSPQAIPFPTTAGAALVTPGYSTDATGYQYVLSAQDDAFVSVFDPTLSTLLYSSLYGEPQVSSAGNGFHGASFTFGEAVTVDAAGNFYLAGTSEDGSLPTTAGAYEANASSCGTVTNNVLLNCAFVAKFSPVSGGTPSLIYGTYLGHTVISSYGDLLTGIAADATGHAYVTGFTNQATFPITSGAYQTTCNQYGVNGNTNAQCSAAFIAELSPSGTALVASTYFGGYYSGANNISDQISSMGPIVLDGSGNVYIDGVASSGLSQVNGFANGNGASVAPFVAEFDSSLATLKFSTLLNNGGATQTTANGLATGSGSAIYVAGSVNSPPASAASSGAFQSAYGGNSSDAYVAKIVVTPPPVATSTALTASSTSATSGTAIVLTATVTPSSGGGTATGTVTFKDGTTALGTGTLNGTGIAMYTANALSVGAHSITAAYGGDSADTASTSTALTVTITAPLPPAAPTGVTASAGNAQVALAWSASSGATSYNLYQGTSAGGEGATAVQTAISGTSVTVTGLTNGTAYYFTVAAVNANGTSAASSEVSATPAAPSGGGGGGSSGGGSSGGGGAFDFWALLALAGLTVVRLVSRSAGRPVTMAACQSSHCSPANSPMASPRCSMPPHARSMRESASA